MMNPADRSLLESLQKAAAPDPVLWAAVESAVEKAGGVRATGGAARAVIDGLVRKHGGNSHDQKTHGGGGSRGGSSSDGGSGGGESSGGRSRGKDHAIRMHGETPEQAAARDAAIAEVSGARGKGMQPKETGQNWPNRNFEPGSSASYPKNPLEHTNHGEVMAQATNGRVALAHGGTASVQGWKHMDDVAAGDTIAFAGRGDARVRAFRIDAVGKSGPNVVWTATPIGKRGKPTGKPLELGGVDLGRYHGAAVSIVKPRQTSPHRR
jgi:hypothetical protein